MNNIIRLIEATAFVAMMVFWLLFVIPFIFGTEATIVHAIFFVTGWSFSKVVINWNKDVY